MHLTEQSGEYRLTIFSIDESDTVEEVKERVNQFLDKYLSNWNYIKKPSVEIMLEIADRE